MQFSKRTFKIHPNCLWNFYGKKKTKQKKMLLAGQKKSQSRKLTETSAARLSSSKSWKASCVVPLPQSCLSCCDVVTGQPVNNQTAFIYTMCSDMAQHLFFFNRSWKCTARSRDPLSAQLPQRRRDSSADFGLCAGHWRIVSLLNEWGLTGQKKYIIEYIL